MTQELVLAVLLTGLVGLVWLMTVSILADDLPKSEKSIRQPSDQNSTGDAYNQANGSGRHKLVA